MSQVDSIGMRVIRFCGRGGGGGRKGGREVKNGGCVSAYGRGRWEEAWKRGNCDQYWSAIEPVLVTYSN